MTVSNTEASVRIKEFSPGPLKIGQSLMIQRVVVPLRNVGQLDVVAHTCSPSTMLFSWSSFFLTFLGHLQLKLFSLSLSPLPALRISCPFLPHVPGFSRICSNFSTSAPSSCLTMPSRSRLSLLLGSTPNSLLCCCLLK